MIKQEFKVIVHLTSPLTRKTIKAYISDAVWGYKCGYHPDDHRRAIKKVTFKLPPKNAKVQITRGK